MRRMKTGSIEYVENYNKTDYEESKIKRRLKLNLPLPERPRVVGCALVVGQTGIDKMGTGHEKSKCESTQPSPSESVANVVDVAAGGKHCLILTNNGQVFTLGYNDEGALGRFTTLKGPEMEPELTELPNKALKVSAGYSHSACLLEDGRVFAWGTFRDSHGNMGLTLEGTKAFPIDILPGVSCCDIASGSDHLVMLSRVGKVYTVGCGEQGQLGRISLRNAASNGTFEREEQLKPGKVFMKRANPIEAIWATNYCTFLMESQTYLIWGFGLNTYKQLCYARNKAYVMKPVKLGMNGIKQITGGQYYTIVLKTNGGVYSIGNSQYGRLGLSESNDVTVLTEIPVLEDVTVASVSSNDAASFALTEDGQLYAWGRETNYQVDGDIDEDTIEPTLVRKEELQIKRFIKASSGGCHNIFLIQCEAPQCVNDNPMSINCETNAYVTLEFNNETN